MPPSRPSTFWDPHSRSRPTRRPPAARRQVRLRTKRSAAFLPNVSHVPFRSVQRDEAAGRASGPLNRWSPVVVGAGGVAAGVAIARSRWAARLLSGPMYHLRGRDGLAVVSAAVITAPPAPPLAVSRPRWVLLLLPIVVGPLYPNALPQLLGDEPHYLTIAESIVDDGDLAVRNQYDAGAVPAAQDAHLG